VYAYNTRIFMRLWHLYSRFIQIIQDQNLDKAAVKIQGQARRQRDARRWAPTTFLMHFRIHAHKMCVICFCVLAHSCVFTRERITFIAHLGPLQPETAITDDLVCSHIWHVCVSRVKDLKTSQKQIMDSPWTQNTFFFFECYCGNSRNTVLLWK
jgi:hypothetical protein